MADAGALKAVAAAQTGFTEAAFRKLSLITVPYQSDLAVGSLRQKILHCAIYRLLLNEFHF
jgi:hypothetical protein